MQPLGRAPYLLRDPQTPRDPAPSKLAYRLQRMWLTPVIRAVLRVGLPAFAVSFAVGFYLSDQKTVDAIALSFLEIRRSIEERPEFMIHVVAIDGASDELVEDIHEIVPLDFPISSFDLDLPGMAELIGDLDAVAKVELIIRPGGVLEVSLVERTAAVVWQSRDALEALDATGHRVGPLMARTDRPDLPFLLGDGADAHVPEAIVLVAAANRVLSNVLALVRVGARRWDLVLKNGPRIQLPEHGAVNALRWVLAQHVAQDLLARDVTSVDMRTPAKPVLRLSAMAQTTMDQMRAYHRSGSN